MDGVLSRLRNTVTGALPGNPISREFELDRQIASSGPGLMWKLYSASKKSSKEPATVWIFEKRLLDRYSKPQRNMMLEKLRHGVSSLTKLRHPRILSVMHPLEDSRESLGFATEPVFTSLANALGRHDNLTGPIVDRLKDFKFTETELKYGILQVCEALLFIHRDSRQLHLNVAPESIIINRTGSWKLCGFEFAKMLPVNSAQSEADDDSVDVLSWQSSVLPLCQPQLDYSSPEAVINGRASPSSDMFSVGMLLYALYNDGNSMFPCKDSYATYRSGVNQLKHIKATQLMSLPESVRDYVKMLLHPDPNVRPDPHELLKLSYFHDPGVSALQSLDELRQLDNLARSRFYKNLPASIRILPKRINLHRVYSQLSEEFANPNMIPFVLPPILEIVDRISREEFTTVILPTFQKVLCIREPVQVLLVLLQNLNILTSKFSPADFKKYMLPVLTSSLETNTTSIVQLCLKSLPDVAQLMDFTVLKSSIVPRLKKAYLRHDLVSLRLETLICLGKVLEYLDKWCVMEDVFPFLVDVKSREPILVVAVLTIYKVAFLHKKLGISRDVLATRVIPHLLQLSMDNNLNLTQYAAFAELIRQMITQLETQQKAKLSELHGQAEESVCIPSFILSPTMTGTSSEMVDLMMSSIGGLNSVPTAPSADPPSRSEVDLFGPTTSENGVASSVGDGGGSQQPACKNPRQLTLEDKKRIMAEAEQSERLRAQPRLSPQRQDTATNTTQQYQQAAPVDLTGKLLSSNLEELSLTRRTTPASATSGLTPFGFGSPQPQLGFPMMSPPIAATPTPLSSGMGGPMAFAAPLTPTSIMVQGPKPANSTSTPLSMSDIDDLLS
ncbi:hypothetical protein AAHC03_01383 [Spirometra sp. Aus1]